MTMNVNYQFSDIIGGVYKNGNVLFMPDGNTCLSPVGNKLKLYLLKENQSRTLAVESNSNICRVALNRSGSHAVVINEAGQCAYINVSSEILLHSMNLGSNTIKCVEFSPDGSSVAVCIRGRAKIFSVGDFTKAQFHPMCQVDQRKLSADTINCINWSNDGQLLVCGGEDRVVRVFSSRHQFANMSCATMSQRYPLISTYFYGDGYNVLSVDRNGMAVIWESSLKPSELIVRKKSDPLELIPPALSYKKTKRNNLLEQAGSTGILVTATALNQRTNIFVAAFSNGVFIICDLPEFSVLQNFRASELRISTLDINATGDWLAIGCGRGADAQLVVWEWQSETYVLKQQSHSQAVTSASYSPDGSLIVTGGEDGKVKIWNCQNSFCLVTFTEHNSGVTDVCFTQSGKAVLSASLEGSVRAHDLKRYRNFRTMVAPKQTQLNCLIADLSGELVMAASKEQFEIYVWSMETGNLLEVLSGHSSIVSNISYFGSTLASTSLDKTMRLWNIVESANETVQLMNEGLDVKFSPCGHMLAVLCYDSCISLFHAATASEIGTIETKLDIDAGRESRDHIKKSTSEKNKTFTCIAFSPDSLLILAGGQSNTFCLYSITSRILLKIFKLTINISLDGVLLDVNYRNFSEFGNMNLIDCSDSEEEGNSKQLKLPGTRHGDLSERSAKPSVRINRIVFGPTGRNFAVVSTEGVSIYTLDSTRRFDPFKLETEITPRQVLGYLRGLEYVTSLCLALRLNEKPLIRKVVESFPSAQIKFIVKSLEIIYAERLLKWISSLEPSALTKHLQFYQLLIRELLYCHGAEFKNSLQKNLPAIVSIQQMLNTQSSLLSKLCDRNKHSIEYILEMRKISNEQLKLETMDGE